MLASDVPTGGSWGATVCEKVAAVPRRVSAAATERLRRARMSAHLDDAVREGRRNLLEPVRRSGRDDPHVALLKLPRLAALDLPAPNLVGGRGLGIHDRAAGYERGGAVEHVDDVGVPRVNLGLS